jgi:energy-coupling factor transporter ATP-binding protein EcfA2
MHGRTRSTLLGLGFATDLIEKIRRLNYTVDALRSASKAKLKQDFTSGETNLIKAKIERAPVPEVVIEEVLKKSKGCCSYCNDGDFSQPYQLHHVRLYSLTQDNSEKNLLLVCPTHHVVIHDQRISEEQQKSTRRAWYSTVEISKEYDAKGLSFPFGAFVPLDFGPPPVPQELIEFAPLSPTTALLCYTEDFIASALEAIEKSGFLLVYGRSGSGKSTYSLAICGYLEKKGHAVFRYRFDKLRSDPMREIASFASNCVRKVVVAVDDANVWATAVDLLSLAKLVSKQTNVRIVATWTSDESEDSAQLSASDITTQALNWIDLRPQVTTVLRKFEAEIVLALQKYEPPEKFRHLGFGIFDMSLEDRINSLGDRPQTVYEFIFSLRGDNIAVNAEFQQLYDDARSDLPVIVAAIEQIAGFERPVTEAEVLGECLRLGPQGPLPTPTQQWVKSVLNRQVSRRKLVRVRDHFTTIHRRWASKLIAAGLASPSAAKTTEELLRPCFELSSDRPERLLRMHSWLKSVEEASPFVHKWEASMPQEKWTLLMKQCCAQGVQSVGFLAGQMHLLRKGPGWTFVVEKVFTENEGALMGLLYEASSEQMYSLKEISMTLEHAARPFWTKILQNWDRRSVAQLLLDSDPNQFDTAWSTFGKARELCPGWLMEVGNHVPWDRFERVLRAASPGDIRSVCKVFAWLPVLKPEVRRSQMRIYAESLGECLRGATLENLREPIFDSNVYMLCTFFPGEACAVLEKLDAAKFGMQFSGSLPRHWRKLLEFVIWGKMCGSNVASRIIQNIDLTQIEKQIRKYGLTSLYELRVLLNFLAFGSLDFGSSLAPKIKDVVRRACTPKDDKEERGQIMKAYVRLDAKEGTDLAKDLGYYIEEDQPEIVDEQSEREKQEAREDYKNRDAQGLDYVLEMYSSSS